MRCDDLIKHLEAMANPAIAEYKYMHGCRAQNCYGIKVSDLRKIAGDLGENHPLALELFDSGIHEARKLASMIDDPQQVTRGQMEKWAAAFDSWDVCDCCCSSLFVKTRYACTKALHELTGPKINILGYPR